MNAHQRRVARRARKWSVRMPSHWAPRITIHGPGSPEFIAARAAFDKAVRENRVQFVATVGGGVDVRWPK